MIKALKFRADITGILNRAISQIEEACLLGTAIYSRLVTLVDYTCYDYSKRTTSQLEIIKMVALKFK